MNIARELINRAERLAGERSVIESHWQEIADIIAPLRADFNVTRTPGAKRTQKIFDGTPGMAAENLAAGLWGTITNAANDWFSLRAANDELDKDYEVRLWLDEVTARMRDSFASDGQRFYSRVFELYADLATFGTAVFYTGETPNGIQFSCRALAECYIAENEREEVDTVFRKFQWSARQAYRQWGDQCSDAIKNAAEKEPEKKFTFLHAVFPREDFNPRASLSPKGKRFASYYVEVEGARIVAESGFHEFPYQVPRWSTRSRYVYGDSPAMLALPDAKMLNAMSKTTIVAAQKAVDPPILAPDESAVRGVRTSPGGIIYGGIDENGRRRYEPLVTGANIGLGLELEEQRRQAVRDAFYASLLLLTPVPGRTATEVLAQQEEKLRLLGPHLGRVQNEFLDPLIDRTFSILFRAGAFPPPPDILVENPDIKVEYVSPLARAQKTSEAQAILQTIDAVLPLAQSDPSVMDNLNLDEVTRLVGDGFGAPKKIFNDPKQVQQTRQARAQAAQAQQDAALAQQQAGTLRDVAQAANVAGLAQ